MAKTSLGAGFYMGPAGGALTKMAGLLSINPPKLTRETIDTTTHDSTGAREFIGEGVYDPGEISGQLNYVAGSAGDDALLAAMVDGEMRDFRLVLKGESGTEDLEFSGILTNYGPDEMSTSGKQTASFSAKVSGAISQNPS